MTPESPPASIIVDSGIRIRGLTKEFIPGRRVLDGIDLHLPLRPSPGAGSGVTAIIGASGSGKTTLMRCINQLVTPTTGEILFDGQNLTHLRGAALRAARRKIGMVFQAHDLVERLTVLENILIGRLGSIGTADAWLRRFPAEDIAEAHTLIEALGLADFTEQRADRLSGGQRQRAGIARALLQRPDFLLADEPTSSLDPKIAAETMGLLTKLAGERGMPVVVNMHNVPLAKRFATRIIGLGNGRIVFDGAPADLSDGVLNDIYGGENWLQ